MKSMTAYSRSELSTEAIGVSIEIRSYNSRFLDTVVRLPNRYLPLEDKIKTDISKAVARGRIEVRIHIEERAEESVQFEVNEVKARAYYRALTELKEILQTEEPVPLALIAASGDIIRTREKDPSLDERWPCIAECLGCALEDLEAMRTREGEFISRDMISRLAAISRRLQRIEADSSGLLEHHRDRLRERIAALTDGIVEIDPDRIAQEAAILAERSDITEEIIRSRSHLKHFEEIMSSRKAEGRKLNFLLQELNREFNTIGSKTEKSAVAHGVVDIKAELEKIREQIQNIE